MGNLYVYDVFQDKEGYTLGSGIYFAQTEDEAKEKVLKDFPTTHYEWSKPSYVIKVLDNDGFLGMGIPSNYSRENYLVIGRVNGH